MRSHKFHIIYIHIYLHSKSRTLVSNDGPKRRKHVVFIDDIIKTLLPKLLFNGHWDYFPGVKETWHEHRSLPSCVEVKNECSYTSALPICHHGMTKENFPLHQFYPVTNVPPCSKSIFMLLQFMLYSAEQMSA